MVNLIRLFDYYGCLAIANRSIGRKLFIIQCVRTVVVTVVCESKAEIETAEPELMTVVVEALVVVCERPKPISVASTISTAADATFAMTTY